MKTETRELLGFNVPIVGVVENLDEAISAAGSKEAVLKDYVNNVLAHSHFAILRRTICSTLETLTGVARIKNDKGTITEKESEYIARLDTQLGEAGLAAHNAAVAEACAKIAVDYTPGTRGAGSSSATPAKKWLAVADQIFAEEKVDAFCAKFGIDRTGVSDADLKVQIAIKFKEFIAENEKKVLASAMASA